MEKSKLLSRLRFFSKEKMADFVLFADSPYFNSNAALTRLLKYLQKHHPELQGRRLSKPIVYKNIFPGKDTYKEKRLNDLMSNLFKLSEDFFAFEQFKKSPVSRVRHELLAYRDNRMDKSFQKTAIKAEKILEQERNEEHYYLEQYLLNKEIFHHPGTERHRVNMKSLEEMKRYLDNFLIMEKNQLVIITKNREKVLNEKHEISLFDSLQKELRSLIESNDVMHFSTRIARVIETEEDNLLFELCEKYKIVQPSLSFRASQSYLFTLLNILARKLREGYEEINSIIFSLYAYAFENNLLLQNGRLTETTFINICMIAGREKKGEWQEKFFREYQNYIFPEQSRNDSVVLARAFIIFESIQNSQDSSKIKEAILLINQLSLKNTSYVYRVKSILLRLYFLDFNQNKDYEEFEFLSYFCTSFEVQIKRNKMWNKKKAHAFLSLISFTRNLAKYLYEGNVIGIEKLLTNLENHSNFFSKSWLQTKAREALNASL